MPEQKAPTIPEVLRELNQQITTLVHSYRETDHVVRDPIALQSIARLKQAVKLIRRKTRS